MSSRSSTCPARRPRVGAAVAAPTLALLAAVGVSDAEEVEILPATASSGASAATNVGAGAGDVVGVDVGRVIDFGSFGSFIVPSTRFWCRSGDGLDENLGLTSTVADVARGGTFACGWSSSGVGQRWTKDGSVTDVVPGPDGGVVDSFPVAISDDGGRLVGGLRDAGFVFRPFVWNAATNTTTVLDAPADGFEGVATDIVPDGSSVVGMYETPAGRRWCRWDDGGPPTDLPILGDVHGISSDGRTIVGRDEDGNAAAVIDGVPVDLGVRGFALAASDGGAVIVGTDNAQARAWKWTPDDGVTFLELEGPDGPVDTLVARGVSPAGNAIAGWVGDATYDEGAGDAPDGPFFGDFVGVKRIAGTIDGDPTSDGRDAYVIEIVDPDAFIATTSPSVLPDAGSDFDTRLWLYSFSAGGTLVLANDDGPDGPPFQSTICDPADFAALTGGTLAPTAPASLAPGTYVLIVSGFPDDPVDAAGVPMADLSDFDALHGPDPAAGPFDAWESGGTHAGGSYVIALRGVEIVPFLIDQRGFVIAPSPDIDENGEVGFSDLLELLSAWGPCLACPQDLDGNGEVGFSDLLELLAAWGTSG